MEGEALTREAVLRALGDVLRAVRLKDGKELTQDVSERVDYVLNVAKLFVELQGCKDFSEVGSIGFGDHGEDDEEDEGEEDEG